MPDLHLICHACPRVQPPPYVLGRCACTEDGVDIVEHVEARRCPLGRFDNAPVAVPRSACVHRGAQTGEGQCSTCSGNVRVKLFACAVHQTCAIDRTPEGVRSCTGCADQRIADAP